MVESSRETATVANIECLLVEWPTYFSLCLAEWSDKGFHFDKLPPKELLLVRGHSASTGGRAGGELRRHWVNLQAGPATADGRSTGVDGLAEMSHVIGVNISPMVEHHSL